MKNILFITSMYPDPLRPQNTPVCHFYTQEWTKMGYNVIVFNFRSIFPPIFTIAAKIFPRLASKIIGNHVEMDRNTSIIKHDVDGITVYSVPIYKIIPHHRYPQKSYRKSASIITDILNQYNITPDVIAGHFLNPAMELIFHLKKFYPHSKSSIVFHESDPSSVTKYYSKVYYQILSSYDLVGFRNNGMKSRYEEVMGKFPNSFICYSGTKDNYLTIPRPDRKWDNNPIHNYIYVGQIVENKAVLELIEGLHLSLGKRFHLTCIGTGNEYQEKVNDYIQNNELIDNITFTGSLNRDEIVKYYDQNDCFIMISRQEAFGLVYLEAMSRGCITIGTKGQGIDGVIVDGENGFLCEGGSASNLSFIINRINGLSADDKSIMSHKAIETAYQYSDPNVAKIYIEELEKLFK